MDTGYAEFNDSTSKLRGIMVAGKGTFSGVFSAQNVNAISHINVRDGAVSAYLGFNFPTTARTAAFAIPFQKETAIADISIPISIWCTGPSQNFPGAVRLYKNGSLIGSASISLPLNRVVNSYSTSRSAIGFPQVVRFIDPDVNENAYYQVELVDNSGRYKEGNNPNGFTVSGAVSINLLGTITVGFRKR